MPSVYAYTDFRQYIQAWLGERSGRNQKRLAKKIGIAPSMFSLILSGKRKITAKTEDSLCQSFDLDAREREYFRLLVRLDQAESPSDMQGIVDQMMAILTRENARPMEVEQYRLLKEWYHLAVYEITRCVGFRPDKKWISEKLLPKVPQREVQSSLNLLVSLNLLRWRPDGGLEAVDDVVIDVANTDPRVRKTALMLIQRWLLNRSKKALEVFSAEERVFSSATVAIPVECVPELNQKIHQFIAEMVATAQREGKDPNRVYQLNVQLFPLSETTDS